MYHAISRRAFIRTGILSALGVRTSRSAGAAPNIRVLVILPAKQMQQRTAKFVKTFVEGYLKTSKPYPVFSVLFRSGLLPDTVESMKAVGALGDLVQHDGSFTFSKPPANDLVLPYHMLISDQTLKSEVSVPKNLVITTISNAANGELAFSFSPSVIVRQIDQLKINGAVAPIPKTILVQRIKISDTTLKYEFSNDAGNKLYGVVLDLQKDSGDPAIDFEQASVAPKPSGTRWLALVACVCIGLVGCSKDDFGKRPGQPAPQPFPDQEVCSTGAVPAGFIRIDSKVAGLDKCPIVDPAVANVYVYANYANQPRDTKILVCADSPIPPGWEDLSGSYQDSSGCDSLKFKSSPFANVRLIYFPPSS